MASIVIVEDNTAVRMLMIELIKETSHHIQGVFKDGSALFKQYDEEPPDLWILDYELPGLNGIEISRNILSRHPSSLILLCTGKVEWVLGDARQLGLDVLGKPFEIHEFIERIESILQNKNDGNHSYDEL